MYCKKDDAIFLILVYSVQPYVNQILEARGHFIALLCMQGIPSPGYPNY